ncbi:preprotein translocase subunit SecG [Phaeodactylibacter xiamenensis]|jgi:preprotein translocase subunit SecG|uniref:preprotein translocase subunit SecG n=1 Tax=Phaeodactylibacter xiamenensis TaxID=1524460 RepID=UPI000592206D|nr:preprotein translocase subunit SecG [Phaeodactylibacter xiamenensis]MCR9054328.1 preprotein translocase subunit SecG [bacterium]MCR9100763.1 preprotein translocase subunit SecG [bacterium]
MLTTMTVLIALVCVLLMGAVLIQNPKGGGVDSTFGGTQANQMFGAAKSTDFIEKATWYLAIALFVLCIVTSMMVGGTEGAIEQLQSQ